jgi:hypothetical protein
MTTNDAWGTPENIGPVVNSPYTQTYVSISSDGLVLFFSDHSGVNKETGFGPPRPGGYGGADMWMTRRASLSSPWQTPANLGPMVNGPAVEAGPRLSLDGRTLYFWTDRNGNWENYQASIVPICDFNSDGIVDILDVGIMIEHWYTDDPLCDIGPFPWGDGFVDAQDLKVLAEHLSEEENPPVEPGQ